MLTTSFLATLNELDNFDLNAFKQVHESGEQITSIRINDEKYLHITGDGNKQLNPKAFSDDDISEIDETDSFIESTKYYKILPQIEKSPIQWCETGNYLASRPSFTLDPLFHAGAYYVQEASSMFLWQILLQTIGENSKGLKVLDLCAAPGGKTTLLSNYFKDSLIISNEVIKSRANILVENVTKWGADNIIVTNNDASHFKALANFFDVVLIDAPCSGSGLFRKDPLAIEEWSTENVQLCSERQNRIIVDSLPCLKNGGLLIYATCSYSRAENEHILDKIHQSDSFFSIKINIENKWNIVETQSNSAKAWGYRFFPHKTKGEGFFVAASIKNGDPIPANYSSQQLQLITKKEQDLLSSFFNISEDYQHFKHQESFKVIRQAWANDLEIIANHLYIKKAGIEVGSIKGKDIIPHHEIAVSNLPLQHIPQLVLNQDEAIQYLKRQDLYKEAQKGWSLVNFCGLSLGWAKVLPNRLNNYYPPAWRILKN